jgi:hypothetical protein
MVGTDGQDLEPRAELSHGGCWVHRDGKGPRSLRQRHLESGGFRCRGFWVDHFIGIGSGKGLDVLAKSVNAKYGITGLGDVKWVLGTGLTLAQAVLFSPCRHPRLLRDFLCSQQHSQRGRLRHTSWALVTLCLSKEVSRERLACMGCSRPS